MTSKKTPGPASHDAESVHADRDRALGRSLQKAQERAARGDPACDAVNDLVDAYLARACEAKHNSMTPLQGPDGTGCPCEEGECQVAEIPDFRPCISVRWGDSKCDCLESDDLEVVCITVCNCYSNISFSHLSIAAVFVTNASGAIVLNDLPDGGHSVQPLPLGPLCFGDIPPCVDGVPGCVSRQFVLRLRGAQAGTYQLNLLGVCYDVCTHHGIHDAFSFNVCPD